MQRVASLGSFDRRRTTTLALALAALLFGAAFYAANVQAGLAGNDPAFAFIAAAPAAAPHGVAA